MGVEGGEINYSVVKNRKRYYASGCRQLVEYLLECRQLCFLFCLFFGLVKMVFGMPFLVPAFFIAHKNYTSEKVKSSSANFLNHAFLQQQFIQSGRYAYYVILLQGICFHVGSYECWERLPDVVHRYRGLLLLAEL